MVKKGSNTGQLFRCDTTAVVFDAQQHIAARGHAQTGRCCVVQLPVGGADAQTAAVGHGVPGVERQVQQHVLQLIGIATGQPEVVGEHQLERHQRADGALQQVPHAADQRVAVGRPHLQRLAPGEGQQPMGQGRRPVCRALGIGEMASQVIVAALIEATFKQAQRADDAAQEVVEVMGEATGELTDRFHLLCLVQCRFGGCAGCNGLIDSAFQRVVQALQGQFGALVLGDIDARADQVGWSPGLVTHVHRPPEQPALALAQQHAEVHFEIVTTPGAAFAQQHQAFAVVVVHALEQVAQVDLAEALHAHQAQHGGVHVDPLARELPIEGPRARDQQRGIQAFVTFLQLRTGKLLGMQMGGNVLDPMDDITHPPAVVLHRRVDHVPEALLESAATGFGAPDGITHLAQSLGLAGGDDILQGATQRRCAGARLLRLMVAEYLEQRLADHVFPASHGDAQALVTAGNHGVFGIRRHDQINAGQAVDDCLQVMHNDQFPRLGCA